MMTADKYTDPESRRALALEYLDEIDTRHPGMASSVDRTEFLREYAETTTTLDEAFKRCRARKNQREAELRKTLRHGGINYG